MADIVFNRGSISLGVSDNELDVSFGGGPGNGGGGVTNHGGLTGLTDDDHKHYHTDARGDARYYTQQQIDLSLADKADALHNHTLSDIIDSGTAAALDVSATGDAAAGQVVKGDDTRLADARPPTTHTHDDRYYTETEVDSLLTGKAPLTGTGTSGTWPISITGSSASTTGNAASADKLSTPRTISLDGDVTGSVAFDGSANASITASVVDDSHNHVVSNVDGLQIALDGKAPLTGTGTSGTWPISITGSSTSTTGNATTASRLATERTISLAGDVTGSVAFDGSTDVSITASVADDSHNHTVANVDGLQVALDGKAPLTGTGTSGTWPISITGSSASTTGNAASASKLATARTISLAGDVTGSVAFDGSANVSITSVVADNSHNHTLSNITDSGTAAALNAPAAGNAAAGEVVKGNDTRLTDARTPTAHNHVESDITDLGAYPDASDGQEGQIPEIRNGVWSFVDNLVTGNVSRTGEFAYNNTPGAIPGNSIFTVDNATPSLVTWLRFDDSDNNNVDQTAFLVGLVKNGWLILIQNMTDSSQWAVFEVTGDSVDAGGYIEVPATFSRDSGNWPVTNNTTCLVDFVARPSPSIYAAW